MVVSARFLASAWQGLWAAGGRKLQQAPTAGAGRAGQTGGTTAPPQPSQGPEWSSCSVWTETNNEQTEVSMAALHRAPHSHPAFTHMHTHTPVRTHAHTRPRRGGRKEEEKR